MSVAVNFDGNDLDALANVEIDNHEFNTLPGRDLNNNKLARADKSILTTAEYVDKEVTIYGRVCATERYAAEILLADIKALIQYPNRALILTQYNEQIQYTATLKSFDHSWLGNKIMFTITFYLPDPIGSAVETTSFISDSITTTTDIFAVNNTGSFICEPTFNLVVSAVTGATNQSITVKNNVTGQGLTVTRTWTAGDILEIDSAAKTARINGSLVDFSGKFPVFYPGIGSVGYIDTFTTRTVAITSTYYKKFV